MELEELNGNGLRVAAYLVAAALAFLAVSREARTSDRSRRLAACWLILGLTMVGLGLARVIDFGPWLTGFGRHQARIEGWYDDRREVQYWTVWGVVAATALASLLVLLAAPRETRPALPASLCLLALGGFVAVRAISFHNVDAVLYRYHYRGLLLNTACELGLVLLFAICVAGGPHLRFAIRTRTPLIE